MKTNLPSNLWLLDLKPGDTIYLNWEALYALNIPEYMIKRAIVHRVINPKNNPTPKSIEVIFPNNLGKYFNIRPEHIYPFSPRLQYMK